MKCAKDCSHFTSNADGSGLAILVSTMGRAKTWSAEECEAAAHAYVAATEDEIEGAGQKGEDFASAVHQVFEEKSPPGVQGTGTFWDRDPNGDNMIVWHYIRDTIMKETQKFNTALTQVMYLSGLTNEEKINVAVAIFLKKTEPGKNLQDYKEFDPNQWRLYKAWKVLKKCPKCSPPSAIIDPADEVVDFQAATGTSTTEAEEMQRESEGCNTDNNAIQTTTKTGRRGRDAAKREFAKQEREQKRHKELKRIAEENVKRTEIFQSIQVSIENHTKELVVTNRELAEHNECMKLQTMAVMLNKITDPAIKERMMEKIVEKTLSGTFQSEAVPLIASNTNNIGNNFTTGQNNIDGESCDI